MFNSLYLKHVLCFFIILLFPLHLFSQDASTISPSPQESLKTLELRLQKELQMINFPARSWLLHPADDDLEDILDVAIVGGGMSGMTVAFALIKEGITNIKIYDENAMGYEGPWVRYARMNMLRSSKACMGPALGISGLTFWSWYEAQYGEDNWKKLKSVPTKLWSNYLNWFRQVLKLPVENNMKLVKLFHSKKYLELTFNQNGQDIVIFARKVVLATGREGAGGLEIPPYMEGVSKRLYAHSAECIDPQIFVNKRIAIVGAGASSFDAAGMALEHGAHSVEMIVRRSAIPQVNKFNQFYYPGIAQGFYFLPDALHCDYFAKGFEYGIPPPKEALERVKGYTNLHIHYRTEIEEVTENSEGITLKTNQGDISADFIILATGFGVNLAQRSELDGIRDNILLWENRVPIQLLQKMPKLGRFPYLGPHFEFQEVIPGAAPYLSNIYCFNYGGFLSHGLLSGDIALLSLGATRLVEGIVIDFFTNDCELYYEKYTKK